MLNWLKKLRRIVADYDRDLESLAAAVKAERAQRQALETILRERTDIAVDVGFKSPSHVIVVGRYKDQDFVQTYSIATPDLAALIDQLKAMERYGVVRQIDAPPQFRGVVKREITW
jgi:hypothetical protein